MKIILTGATGFVGAETLRQALADPEIEKILVLTRRPLGRTHSKLEEVVLRDFLDYTGLELRGYDACIWCLGVSQTQVGKDEYVRITVDYVVAAARAMQAANPALRFCFVSGQSADPSEQKGPLYARIKGRAERKLGELGARVFIFRPAYIRPTARSGPRRDFARYFTWIGTLITWLKPDFYVDCDQLAACLIGVAKSGAPSELLDNRTIKEWRGGRAWQSPDRHPQRTDGRN